MGSPNLEAQPLKLTDTVSYQDNAVVSRTLVKAANGSVTVFAFDGGQALSEHTVPHDALVLVLDGEAEITVSGQAKRVAESEAILMPANQPHAVRATRPFKMMLVMIKS
jgi:quercetin dioxygenase-like cupin family protein